MAKQEIVEACPIPLWRAAIWVLCLAVLSVGARNFESGIGVDAKTYASLARTMAQTGEWFRMEGTTPEFVPFAEHPHLGIWFVALIFKILPAADWSGRIPGHFFYCAFLILFFWFVQKKSSERAAVLAVLLLWGWARFSNFFSNIYLDPACLFFGFSSVVSLERALKRGSVVLGGLAGFCLVWCAMAKGMTALGFGPVLGWIVLQSFWSSPRRRWFKVLGSFVLALCGMAALYYIAVQRSSVPDFFDIYFQRQWSRRFAYDWDWGRVFGSSFWIALQRDTGHLAILGLLSLPGLRRRWDSVAVPFVTLGTFVLMYAPTNRFGANYNITLLPWIAWLIASGVSQLCRWDAATWMKWTGRFAVVAVLIVQYLPIPTHGASPPAELEAIQRLKKAGRVNRLVMDLTPNPVDFTITDTYFWYSDLPTRFLEKADAVPVPQEGDALVVYGPLSARERELKEKGWCPFNSVQGRVVWLALCP